MALSVACLVFYLGASAWAADKPAPIDWTGHDINGNVVHVPGVKAGDSSGVSVLLFAMADQGRSQDAAKQLTAALKVGGAKVIVVVSGQEASEGARRFAAVDGATWPVVADSDYSASGTFDVHVWPTTVILSPDGTIAGHVAGLPKSYLADVEAHVALAAGKIDQAELERRLAGTNIVADDPEQMACRRLIVADRLLDKGLKQEAQRELEAAINLHPASAQAKFSVARIALAVGQTKIAVDTLNAIPADAISPSQMNLLRGKVFSAQGQWDSAVPALIDAVKLNPQPAEAWYFLGLAYDQLKEPGKAAEAYRKAFEATETGRKLRQD
jgi:tetratricopeptide (TPR) repeat protein